MFDAVINAMLCQQFPGPEYTSFLTDLYADDEFPALPVRPPADWNPDQRIPIPPAVADSEHQGLAEVYRQLYSARGASYSDLYEALRKEWPPNGDLDIMLLGDHSNAGCASRVLTEHSDLLEGAVRETASRWFQPTGGPGRSVQELLALEAIQVRRRPSNQHSSAP